MKVLHVIPSMARAHGGPSRAMRMIEQALLGHGIVMETASTDDDGAGGRNGHRSGELISEDGAMRRYFRKTANTYKVSFAFAHWVLRHARAYDLIHLHAMFSFTSTVTAWAARLAGVPYVVRPLGTLGVYGLTQRRPWLKRLSMSLVEGPILRHAAAVHFTSVAEQLEVESLGYPIRGAVIPLAVQAREAPTANILPVRFPQLMGQRHVLYLSRLDPKKNVEGLLGAIALCKDSLPGVQWLIAGDGTPTYVARLRELADQLDIADRVIWAGHLDGQEKTAAFAFADLFVLPSYSENFGIAAAEALQAGLPVVLGKGVALAEQVESAGAGKAVDTQPESIASAMLAYLQDPAARALASTNALVLVAAEFSLERVGNQLADLYTTILAAPDRNWSVAASQLENGSRE